MNIFGGICYKLTTLFCTSLPQITTSTGTKKQYKQQSLLEVSLPKKAETLCSIFADFGSHTAPLVNHLAQEDRLKEVQNSYHTGNTTISFYTWGERWDPPSLLPYHCFPL